MVQRHLKEASQSSTDIDFVRPEQKRLALLKIPFPPKIKVLRDHNLEFIPIKLKIQSSKPLLPIVGFLVKKLDKKAFF